VEEWTIWIGLSRGLFSSSICDCSYGVDIISRFVESLLESNGSVVAKVSTKKIDVKVLGAEF
jgi:hypothetical protein